MRGCAGVGNFERSDDPRSFARGLKLNAEGEVHVVGAVVEVRVAGEEIYRHLEAHPLDGDERGDAL